MLTDKAKADFEEWYNKHFKHYTFRMFSGNLMEDENTFEIEFNRLPFSMQQGVYLEFFREQIAHTNSSPDYYHSLLWCFSGMDIFWGEELLTQAIKKANKIYNERNANDK